MHGLCVLRETFASFAGNGSRQGPPRFRKVPPSLPLRTSRNLCILCGSLFPPSAAKVPRRAAKVAFAYFAKPLHPLRETAPAKGRQGSAKGRQVCLCVLRETFAYFAGNGSREAPPRFREGVPGRLNQTGLASIQALMVEMKIFMSASRASRSAIEMGSETS